MVPWATATFQTQVFVPFETNAPKPELEVQKNPVPPPEQPLASMPVLRTVLQELPPGLLVGAETGVTATKELLGLGATA
jgi:hypothetical protein